jgi:hypothetical protein
MTTTASESKRSRRCKNGYRKMARSLVAPKSGMVSKIGGNTVIPFVPVNVRWPRGGERNRSKMGSDPGVHGPVGEAWWRPRPVKTTLRVPGTSAPRVVSNETANDRISLSLSLSISFPAQSLVSRSKYRLACVHHNSIPPIIIFCFVMAGGAAATVNNNTTYFGTTWIFSRPK